MQHLELCHPENGESPFIATNHDRLGRGGRVEPSHSQPYRSTSLGRDSTPSLATPSSEEDYEDDAYVDCPAKCGETVLVADLVSHMELHGAEDFPAEEVDPTLGKDEGLRDSRDGGKTYDQAMAIYRQPSRAANQLLSPKSRSATPDQTSESPQEKRPKASPRKKSRDEISFKDLKDRLLGRNPKKTSHSSTHSRSKRHSGVRRLGVTIAHALYRHFLLITTTEIRAWPPRL